MLSIAIETLKEIFGFVGFMVLIGALCVVLSNLWIWFLSKIAK